MVQRFIGCESTVIVPPSIFHPLGIALFPDGDKIIAGFEKSNMLNLTHSLSNILVHRLGGLLKDQGMEA
jgi:hypothetical protein